MSKSNDGGAAWPHDPINVWTGPNRISEQIPASTGMSKRDYFAAAALTGLLSSLGDQSGITKEDYAKDSYDLADAMVAASEAKP